MNRVMLKLARPVLGVVCCLVMAGVAQAIIFYQNPTTLFVGKGDYQTACGLNNAQAQTKLAASSAASWAIDSVVTTEYDVTCEWDTVTGGRNSKIIHHIVTNNKTTSVAKTLAAFDTRKSNQITGIFLTLGATISTGTAPVVGDRCHDGENEAGNGWVTAVVVTSETTGAESVLVDCTNGGSPTTLVGVVGPAPLPAPL